MAEHFDLVGIGACYMDCLGITKGRTPPDTKQKMEEFLRMGGGPVSTALVVAAKLGCLVAYHSILGADSMSNEAIDSFKQAGVNTDYILIEEGCSPGFCFVHVNADNGERTIWWTDNSVAHFDKEKISGGLLARTSYLLIDEYQLEAGIAGANIIHKYGGQVVLDAETPRAPLIEEACEVADILILPQAFAFDVAGTTDIQKAAKSFYGEGKAIIITSGVHGVIAYDGQKYYRQDAFKVKVVDTTGAGDIFHGACIYGFVRKWHLAETIRFASAAAAINCTALGGRGKITGKAEIETFLSTQK